MRIFVDIINMIYLFTGIKVITYKETIDSHNIRVDVIGSRPLFKEVFGDPKFWGVKN